MWRTEDDTPHGLFQASYLNRANPSYIPVPLVSVHVNVEVVNFCGKVEVTHKFVNKEMNPIECIYFFPVEEEAAVVKFTAQLQGREIRTVVKEKQEAGQDYSQAIANRQTAFLLEEAKPDIFEMKVGYLPPGEVATLIVTYLTELPVEEGKTKLTIPTTVAPRYIPRHVDDPEVAKKLGEIRHSLGTPADMKMDLVVIMRSQIVSVDSSSHKLKTTSKKEVGEFFQVDATFAGHVADMDRDMVIFINSEEPNRPTVILEKNEEGSVAAMLSFVPQFNLKDQKIEAVFLVDCSGSMQGDSMELARQALQVFIHSLPAGSFFNIVRFGSSFEYLFSHSKPYDDHSLREAKMFIQKMWANLGGTEIYQPLELILRMDNMAGTPRQVFVLTDGKVSNSSSCIDLVKKFSDTNRVFTLGVGSSADRHLVKGMARVGQGTALFTTQGESLTAKVINQLRNGLQPCITDLSVKWGNIVEDIQGDNHLRNIETEKTLFGYAKPKIGEGVKPFSLKHQAPEKIPPIYDGSRLLVYKLLDETIDANDVVVIQAKTPEGVLKLEVPVRKESFINGDSVHKLFARKMIQYIEENQGKNYVEESKKFISEIALKFQVASKHTSFVGVDETQRDSGNFVIKRRVKNQLPQNSSSFFGGGFRGGPTPLFGGRYGFGGFGGGPAPLFGGLFGGGPPPGQGGFSSAASTNCLFGSSVKSDSAAFGAQQQSFSFGNACSGATQNPVSNMFGSSSARSRSRSRSRSRNLFGSSSARSRSRSSSASPSGLFGSSSCPITSKTPKSVSISLYQSADGSFPADEGLAKELGTNLQTLMQEVSTSNLDTSTWITAVVVCYLKAKLSEEKDTWELIVDKSEKWLKLNGVGFVSVYLEKARQFVNSQLGERNDEKKVTCPSGHTMVEVKSTDGSPWFCDSKQECVGGCSDGSDHSGVAVWRCQEDWRIKQGGTCDFDICGACMDRK